MNLRYLAMLAFFLLLAAPRTVCADDYPLTPDSLPQPGVPQGEVTHHNWTSQIFPGTTRDYWVYVPKQYDPAKPACVMVFQDGGGFQDRNSGFRVPVVFDNLIQKKEMPVTIAIMINPGVVPADSPNALPRFNRSVEYDGMSDEYARFLLEEILPEVGKKVRLTTDPNGRALCGANSGGICAFTAAWERPDQFHRVLSFIGSFTNLRGGHNVAWMIRKFEPRPLRVYLQDGSQDQDIYSGSWYLGNQDVAAALKFAGYDSKFVVGTGGHDGRQGAALLPDALRWLWRDYPAPIPTPVNDRQPILEVLLPGETWEEVARASGDIGGLTADVAGTVTFSVPAKDTLEVVGQREKAGPARLTNGGVTGLALGPEGRLYACQPAKRRIVALDKAGKWGVVAGNVNAAHLVVSHSGNIYYADARDGKIWLLDRGGRRRVVDTSGVSAGRLPGLPPATGMTLTPDQSLLIVASPDKFAYSFHVRPDGSLTDRQPYFDLSLPYGLGVTGAAGMTTDTQGRLYVASLAGIQVCDQAGRVIGIIANPDRTPTMDVVFGGPNRDILYVASGGKVYARKTKVKGVLPFEAPIKPPMPRL